MIQFGHIIERLWENAFMRRGKSKCVIFGNCQADAMVSILSDHEPFARLFEIVPFKPVYLMAADDMAALDDMMSEVDLLIAQEISPSYLPPGTRGLQAHMPATSKALLFQIAWFNAYNPDMTYLKSNGRNLRGAFGDYHSQIVFDAFRDGLSVEQTMDALNAERDATSILRNFENNIAELRQRERNLHIGIADEIERSFQSAQLFNTFNHPAAPMQFYVVDKILGELGLPPLAGNIKYRHAGLLASVRWPINASVAQALGLRFRSADFFHIDGPVSPRDFVERQFDFYRQMAPADVARMSA